MLKQYGGSAFKMWQETGILLPIGGGAAAITDHSGYNQSADILVKTVDGVPLNELWDEFNATLNIINAERDPLIQRLTFPVEKPFDEVMPVVVADFEQADEFGQPVGIRLGTPWNMGYDLNYWDLGIRYTFRYLGRAVSGEIRALNNEALDADRRLIYRTVFNRIFDNTNAAVTLEASGRATTAYPFYNGAVTALQVAPPTWKSYSHTTSHNHYLVSGNSALTSANLTTMYDHLLHHGYHEGADVFVVVNRVEAKRIRAYRVASSDEYDFIPAPGQPDATFRGTLVGDLAASQGNLDVFPGFIGRYGPIGVIEEDMIPSGYVIMLASGGKRAPRNPVGLREHENPGLRGLKLIPQFERYPLRESFYHHAIGAGIRHPGAGVVMQVTSNGTYAAPASFTLGGPGGR